MRSASVAARVPLRLIRTISTKALSEAKRFYRYRISKSFFALTVERTSTIQDSIGIAIVALYPRGPLLNSVKRLLDTLTEENYLVIAVVNESDLSEEWIAELRKLNITLLSRPNIGRDFGAYKIGYLFAEQHGLLSKDHTLIFANDSVYYGPHSQTFLHDLLKEEHPWTAMFVNHEIHTHAQSFFIRLSSEIFTHASFRAFWHDYYPSEARKHTINEGEAKLSGKIMELGHVPYSHVSADRILSSSRFGEFTENEKHNLRRFSGVNRFRSLSLNQYELEQLMRREYLTANITHAQGTLASRVLGAPLKLDLDPRFVTQEALRDTLLSLGCSTDEAYAAVAFILQPGGKQVVPERPSLHELMNLLHDALVPRTYLEVGVFKGDSLKLARCPAVGIDPAPAVTQRLPPTAQVVESTSDAFFAEQHPLESLFRRGGMPTTKLVRDPQRIARWVKEAPRRSDGELYVELALIDGMHHAEFALRDFMNIEHNSAPWSVIVFDDMLPENQVQALRARATVRWTGDVFRLEKVLNTYRPDLVTVRVDILTGALVVFAPNHLDQRLPNAYDQIVAESVQSDPQVVPDDVLRRNGVLSIEALDRSGVLQVVRTARERRASSDWVAREVRAALAGVATQS